MFPEKGSGQITWLAKPKTHLYKDFAPLFNDIGLMFQVVFGGLTDVYLHALLRQTHAKKYY